MGHLTTLVTLRLRLGLREASGQRGLVLGVLAAAPGLMLGTLVMMTLVFLGLRALEHGQPGSLVPLVAALATLAGLMGMVAPLAGGVSATDIPDVLRLRHFPIRPTTLVVAHLLSTLTHPLILVQGLVPLSAAAALARSWPGFLAGAIGFLTSWATVLTAAQATQLGLSLWARQPRRRDWILLLGAPVGIGLGLFPFVLLGLGPERVLALYRVTVERDPFALSPLGWGARAGVLGAQGATTAWAIWLALGLAALAAAVGVTAWLTAALGRTEISHGGLRAGGHGLRARGVITCLVEKDLRLAWRDPALRITLVMGLVAPLLVVLLLSRGGLGVSPGAATMLGVFLGLSASGMNVFALERRAVALLLSFPVERWKILIAKNLTQLALRAPVILGILVAVGLIGSTSALVTAAATAACVWLVGSGADAVVSLLHPHPFPPPGGNPTAHRSGAAGLAAAGWAMARVAFVLVVSVPFMLLVSLPQLLAAPGLAGLSIPLAIAGSLAVHALLIGWAEHLLLGRETSVLARILRGQ